MYSSFSITNLPTEINEKEHYYIELGKIKSKIVCVKCKIDKKKCSKEYPSCKRCIESEVACKYTGNKVNKEIWISKVPATKSNINKNVTGYYKVRLLLLDSLIDDDLSPIYINEKGLLDYYGQSPACKLMAQFMELNGYKKIKLIQVKDQKPYHKTTINANEKHLLDKNIIESCYWAYFHTFAIYFPFVTEAYLKKYGDKLLHSLVLAIGFKYLDTKVDNKKQMIAYLDNICILEFKKRNTKPNLNLLICLSLMGIYQIIVKDFKRCWLYQSYTISYNLLLGCHYNTSKIQDQQLLTVRRQLWWFCCILDKVNTILLNRPTLIPANNNLSNPIVHTKLKIFNQIYTNEEFILVRNYLSNIYLWNFNEMAEFMGYIHAKNNPDYKLTFKIQHCFNKFVIIIKQSLKDQPNWVIQLATPLICFNKMVMFIVLIMLFQKLIRFNNKDKDNLNQMVINSSINIIVISYHLKESFIKCGHAFRFFALTAATMALANNLNNYPNLKLYFDMGFTLLEKAKDYLEIVEEFYIQVKKIKLSMNL